MDTNIRNLIDLKKIDTLLEGFNKSTGFVTAILDLDGNILSKSGWRPICTEFHRTNPETLKRCTISDTELANTMGKGEKYHAYKCLNGLMDVAVPLKINGEHVANLFSGQFFFEKPDVEFFRKQAKEFGFDEKEYLDALSKVPVVSEPKVKTAMDFLLNMTEFISDLAIQKLEQEKITQDLKNNEEKYRRFFDDDITGDYRATLDGKIIMCNDAFVKMLKYKNKEEIYRLNTFELYFENSNRESFLNKLRTEKKLQNNELTLKAQDGSKVEIIENVVGIFDENGELKEFIGYMWDDTARKQAEKEQLKLSHAIEQSPASVFITDLDGNIEYVNPKATQITGYTKEELIGKNPRIFSSGEKSKMEYQQLWSTILSGNEWVGEFHNKKKNGELYWESASISPIIDENKDIINFIAVKEDITIRKKFEQTRNLLLDISRSATTYFTLFPFLEKVHHKIRQILRADNFYVALYNEADKTFSFPYHVDEYDDLELNQPYDISNGLTDYVLKSNQALVITPEYQREIEKDGTVKGYGDELSVWMAVPLRFTEEGKPKGVIAIQDYKNLKSYSEIDKSILEIIAYNIGHFIERIRYMEDLVRAKEKAEESDRLKSAFLANMSHEIRTPMNGILGFTNLLLEPDLSSEEREEYINIVHQSGQRMLNTVNDIVEISKIEAGMVQVIENEIDINKDIEELIHFFRPEAEKKGLNLIFENLLPPDKKNLLTDPSKLDSILTNLIKNAIKYTDSGTITVGCRLKDSEVEFYVKDTGVGIPAHRREAIFNRFEQSDIADTRAFQGSGLGLAISKSYIEMLGGNIWVESREGAGSTFYFTLPAKGNIAKKSNAEKENPSGNEKPNPNVKSLKILIAEDDETSSQYLRILVNDFGNEILEATTGSETIEICRQNNDLDLIFMDIQMPGLDGYEATRQIREFNRDVVIIAQTAYALSGDREKAIEAGCNDYISKPINKAELQTLIQKYFGK